MCHKVLKRWAISAKTAKSLPGVLEISKMKFWEWKFPWKFLYFSTFGNFQALIRDAVYEYTVRFHTRGSPSTISIMLSHILVHKSRLEVEGCSIYYISLY